MKKILLCAFAFSLAGWAQHSEPAKVAGNWHMSVETPHGPVNGPFVVKQEGPVITITYTTELFGTAGGTGTVEGNQVSFGLSTEAGAISFSGTVDGAKMTGTHEMGGAWSATRDGTEPASKTILGTVTDFRVNSLELGVKPDDGGAVWVKFSSDTVVLLSAPGDKDLSHAQPARIADVARNDRVLVSFLEGMSEARRIVVVSANDIARRNAAERLDWEKRGVSGVVVSRDTEQIVIESRSPQGAQRTTLAVTAKTKVRRYSPDSVKFADAEPASADAISVGDQVRARGDRSADGSRVTAEDVVFGTFLTTLGTVTEVDHEKHELKLVDITSKQPLVVRLTADTRLKKIPDLHEMAGGHGGHQPANFTEMLLSLPAGSLDDLKAGSSVVVTSTRGSQPGRVTGIMVIANMDPLIQMAQSQVQGLSPAEALNRMHGGAMSGPGGFSLPAILQ
ncbi:MAG TPA: hypothetical protein VMB03_21835 [Bryobacteraceae bacterium]|nr:hypothetical protein [Bryobacteraceae bacterium]